MVKILNSVKDDIEVIKLVGHAGFAKNGENDIVCSAISALYLTFYYSVSELGLKDVRQHQTSNLVSFEVNFGGCDENILTAYKHYKDFFFRGLALLEYTYPENIKIEKEYQT